MTIVSVSRYICAFRGMVSWCAPEDVLYWLGDEVTQGQECLDGLW